jgi:hypothetical protein
VNQTFEGYITKVNSQSEIELHSRLKIIIQALILSREKKWFLAIRPETAR